jgi:hypothetical protein
MRSSKYPTQENSSNWIFLKIISRVMASLGHDPKKILGHEPTNNFGHYWNDADFYFLEKSLRKRKADIYT